jgi:CARDB
MLRRALLLALGAAVLPTAAADARPPARAVLVACERGVEESERAAVFEGRMSALPGTARLQMRFALQTRGLEGGRWSAVAAPGWDAWVTSDPGRQRYVYTKRVERLPAPGEYRTVVRFRWLDREGAVLARSRAASRACRQPDPRPDLDVRDVTVAEAATPGRVSYLALVRNTGRGAAPRTAVRLTVAGRALAAAEAPELGPGRTALVAFEGPVCPAGASLVAVADAGDDVEERDEADNVLTLPCPPGDPV